MTGRSITFVPDDLRTVVADEGSLLDAAIAAGVPLAGVCGGRGICQRCWVIVVEGEVGVPPEGMGSHPGEVLACLASAGSDAIVEVPVSSRIEDEEILTGIDQTIPAPAARMRIAGSPLGLVPAGLPESLAFALPLELVPPSIEDPVGDLQRVERELGRRWDIHSPAVPLDVVRGAPELLRDAGWSTTAVVARDRAGFRLVDLRPGTAGTQVFGLAVDIGTTTLVVHLVDLATGAMLGAAGALNPQVHYGDDVITRIIHAREPGGLEQLREAVLRELNGLVGALAHEHDVARDQIVAAVVAGNTTMIHLFLGLPPAEIRRDPYVPVTNAPAPLEASQVGLRIHPRGMVTCLPGIASYVGGDIVADVLAAGMDSTDELSMLIDAGTNGETVIGNRDYLICCACSAGPAFEGGGISSGMRAARGAIGRVEITAAGELAWETIDGLRPRGICGSGLVDLIAAMLRAGWVDRAGRLRPDAPAVREVDGRIEVLVAPADVTATGRDITITAGDLETLIRSKGAVYAGAAVLARRLGVEMTDLERVYVAGGFGTNLDIRNAIQIGLLPDIDPDRVTFIGNGSVTGARMALLSTDTLRRAEHVAGRMTYRELSTDGAFMDEYVSSLFLPHTDCARFPRACAEIGAV